MKNIVILGGGTAGWMAAILFAKQWGDKDCAITLIESSDIGIIGVGEGSTPALKQFFDQLNIEESEWMPACNATYKCGIRFDKWSHRKGFSSYFHPFASMLDKHSLPIFIHNSQSRLKGLDVCTTPDRFFITNLLAKKCLAPKTPEHFPFDMLYGYHFDSGLLGQFLKRKSISLGVRHRFAKVSSVTQSDNGNINFLTTDQGEQISGDFFIDATGFSSLLLQKTLKVPFNSYQENLFNDSAVTMPSIIGESIPSETQSTALKNGWAWKIPLTNRFGNGYVYSSAFCSAEEAELELRQHLQLLDADLNVKHLKMKIGRVNQHWFKNCLAVGLSQGFIEPLEATALFLVQQTLGYFIDYFEKGNFTDKYQAEYNQKINQYFEGTRDYIVTHYKTSDRQDTEYWRENTCKTDNISNVLQQIYSCWMSGGDLSREIERLKISHYYSAPSWYCILSGMGIFPSQDSLRKPGDSDNLYDLKKLDDFLQRCSLNFQDHRQFLHHQ